MSFFSFLLYSVMALSILTSFFWLFLSKETHFKWNRTVLIANMIVALLLPLLPSPDFIRPVKERVRGVLPVQQWEVMVAADSGAENMGPIASKNEDLTTSSGSIKSVDTGIKDLLFWLYGLGVMILLGRFSIQLLGLARLIRKSELRKGKQYHLVTVSKAMAPFSFGRYIFLNPSDYTEEQLFHILDHEKIHIRHYHTLDLILAELVILFQWFNPFAWLHRNFIIQNLEFLVDDAIIAKGEPKKDYQYHLLQTAVPNYPLSITPSFNQLLIKKRIMMMNCKRSSLSTSYKYFLLLPLGLLLFSLSPGQTQGDDQAFPAAPLITPKTDLERAYVFIANTTSQSELKALQDELAEHGLMIRFEKLTYDGQSIDEVEAVFYESSAVRGISQFSAMMPGDFIFFSRERDLDAFGTFFDASMIRRMQEQGRTVKIFKAGVDSSEQVLARLETAVKRRAEGDAALRKRRLADPNWKGEKARYYTLYDQVDDAVVNKIKSEIEQSKGEVRYFVEGIEWDAAEALGIPSADIQQIAVGHEQYKKFDEDGNLRDTTPWNLEIKIQRKLK